jgi:hypothetical protein
MENRKQIQRGLNSDSSESPSSRAAKAALSLSWDRENTSPSLLGVGILTRSDRREEGEDAAAKFHGLKTEGRGVKRAGDDPELFGAAGGGVDPFRVAAGEGDVFFVTDEKDGEGSRGHGFFRRDFGGMESRERFAAIEKRPTEGREERFSEERRPAQPGVIVGRFAKAGEGRFGDNRFDARIGCGGLQGDPCAHGFAQNEDMFWQRTVRPAGPVPLDRKTGIHEGRKHCVNDGSSIIAFEPTIRGDRAFAGAVSASVHHDDAVAGSQKKFGLADDADAVIGDAVKEEDPAAVGLRRGNFPAAEHGTVGGANVEVFAVSAGEGKGGVRFPNEVGSQFAPDGMEVGGADQPAGQSGQKWREEQKDECDADQAPAHVLSLQQDTRTRRMEFK